MGTWKPEECAHGKMGLAGGCEQCYDQHAELTSIASQRVTLEGVVTIIIEAASKAFGAGKDGIAGYLRDVLAPPFKQQLAEVTKKQQALLKEMHPELAQNAKKSR